jgi:hypothetical protein
MRSSASFSRYFAAGTTTAAPAVIRSTLTSLHSSRSGSNKVLLTRIVQQEATSDVFGVMRVMARRRVWECAPSGRFGRRERALAWT